MKKLLMCSAAIALGLAVAAPAKADGIKLDLAGHFKGYVTWIGQDNATVASPATERHFDILRETEIHFTGETTLDNGLTVGVHHEADLDSENDLGTSAVGGGDLFATEESYAYFSGAWGRVNFGKEDGANYLLQVAAPSADENYDGLRQFINPENLGLTDIAVLATNGTGGTTRGFANNGKLDYANDATGYANKITYLTPVWSGFQAGASYTPSVSNNTGLLPIGGVPSGQIEGSRAFGVHTNSIADDFGDAWEGALRYEGKFQEVGVTLGGGYTHVARDHQTVGANTDNFIEWNLGGAVAWQQLGLGVAYSKDNGGLNDNGDNRSWVAGIDWTTGPFKIGASYLNNREDLGLTGGGADDGQLKTTRWAGGVVYTYGPGMTFRGSVGFVRSDLPDEQTTNGDTNATDLLLGTQINF